MLLSFISRRHQYSKQCSTWALLDGASLRFLLLTKGAPVKTEISVNPVKMKCSTSELSSRDNQ